MLVGTGVDVMNPVVLDDVDASTLVLTAVADKVLECSDSVKLACIRISGPNRDKTSHILTF